MKATKWNKVKKFETWRSWTFFCSLSRVSAHECFKSFCRLPRRDREVVNRLTCFFDMKSKKKTSMIYFKNVVFQLLGNNLVFTRMTWLTQIKKSLRQQSGKSINIIFFTTILWTVAICKTRAFLQSLLAKKTTQMQRKSGKSNMQTLIHKNLILSFVCSVQASLQYTYTYPTSPNLISYHL